MPPDHPLNRLDVVIVERIIDIDRPWIDPTRELPVLVQHGTSDPMIPVDRGRETRDRLIRMGVDLSYREYEMQHELRPESLRDLVTWLDDKVFQPIMLA